MLVELRRAFDNVSDRYKHEPERWVVALVIGVIVALLWALWSAPATSQTWDLGLQVGRVAANEGAFMHRFVRRMDTALVWQVVRENGGDTRDKMGEFLALHSPRVHGTRPCLRGNCLWSPELSRDGVQPSHLSLPADLWAIRIQPIWLDVLAYSDWLVNGLRKEDDPCPIKPRTWGGPMDRDRAIARGLYPIGCYGSCGYNACNDGFAPYASCWKAGLWVCDQEAEPPVESVDRAELWASFE